jgi:hypothetical protein
VLSELHFSPVISHSRYYKIVEYAWGLGTTTNNNVRILVVYMGFTLIKEDPLSKQMQPSLQRIHEEGDKFKEVQYFKILRGLDA